MAPSLIAPSLNPWDLGCSGRLNNTVEDLLQHSRILMAVVSDRYRLGWLNLGANIGRRNDH